MSLMRTKLPFVLPAAMTAMVPFAERQLLGDHARMD